MVLNYINEYAVTCGAQYVGGVSSKVPLTEAAKNQAGHLGRDLAEAVTQKKIFPQQQAAINMRRDYFRKVILSRKEDWREEYQYWKDKGWL
jgi:hypothetical protein